MPNFSLLFYLELVNKKVELGEQRETMDSLTSEFIKTEERVAQLKLQKMHLEDKGNHTQRRTHTHTDRHTQKDRQTDRHIRHTHTTHTHIHKNFMLILHFLTDQQTVGHHVRTDGLVKQKLEIGLLLLDKNILCL